MIQEVGLAFQITTFSPERLTPAFTPFVQSAPPLFSSSHLRCLTLNATLWGDTALIKIGNKVIETVLHLDDESRAHELVKSIRRIARDYQVDLVCLQEVFDLRMAKILKEGLADLFPQSTYSPALGGIDEVLGVVRQWSPSLWRMIEKNIDRLGKYIDQFVTSFPQNHYGPSDSFWASARQYCFPENRKMQFLQKILGQSHVWGAGLLMLSVHPMESTFIRHPVSADLERFALKGVMHSIVRPPKAEPVMVLHTHLQEGESPEAVAARTEQIRHLRSLMDDSPYRALVIGDFNTDQNNFEQCHLAEELGLPDSYLAHYGHLKNPLTTFSTDNRFARRKGEVPPVHRGQRLDGIYSDLPSDDFQILPPFLNARGELLTDHQAVFASYRLMELAARVYVGVHPALPYPHLALQN